MTKTSRNSILKVGDTIDAIYSIEFDIDDDNIWDNEDLDIYDYKRKYEICYYLNDKLICWYEDESEAGLIPIFDGNIEELIKLDLPNTFEEIAEYEIFDIDNKYYNQQRAKIRIKSFKA